MNGLLRRSAMALLLAAVLCSGAIPSPAQDAAKRRLVDRVAAPYPNLARNMALEGVVKVEAVVGPGWQRENRPH